MMTIDLLPVFEDNDAFYPQVVLEECWYTFYMFYHDRRQACLKIYLQYWYFLTVSL